MGRQGEKSMKATAANTENDLFTISSEPVDNLSLSVAMEEIALQMHALKTLI
jgi:hypothetical protein